MYNDQWVTDLWKLLGHNSKMFFLNFNLKYESNRMIIIILTLF